MNAAKEIPAAQRMRIPVIADDVGVLGVLGFGANLDRYMQSDAAIEIRFEDYDPNMKK